MDQLEIEIDATGTVKVTTHGIKGKRCLDYREIFRDLLGPVQSSELTADYSQIEATQTNSEVHVQQRVRNLEF